MVGKFLIIAILSPFAIMLGGVILTALPLEIWIIAVTIAWIVYAYYVVTGINKLPDDKPKTHIGGHKIVGRRNWNREIVITRQRVK